MKDIHYISAGAGAGKTTELVGIICDLAQGNKTGYPCSPERMILTTFTKAAASEFRERVKQRLFAIGNHKQAIAADAAQMGTIDAIAECYICRYWYLLEMSPDLAPVSEGEAKRMMDEALMKVVSEEDIAFFHRFADDFSIVKPDGGIDYDYWKSVFSDIAALVKSGTLKEDKIEEWGSKSVGLLKEAFIPTTDFTRFLPAADAYISFCRKTDILYNSKTAEVAERKAVVLEDVKKKAGTEGRISLVDIKRMSDVVLDKHVSLKKAAKDRYAVPVQEAFEDLQDAVSRLVPKEADSIAKFAERIVCVAKDGLGEYDRAKRAAGVIDFSDMEACFLKLLGLEEVKKDISASVDYLFVDEFQDCNALQIEIFSALSDLVKQSWFVGDMKQAIYGFRGSDTALVADFAAHFPKDEKDGGTLTGYRKTKDGLSSQILDVSHRSVPGLVNLANKVFVQAFQEPYVLHGEDGKELFRYDKEIIRDEEQIRLLEDRKPEGTHPVLYHLNLQSENARALPYDALATYVTRLLNGEVAHLEGVEIRPSDVAILARSNDHVIRIAEALRSKHVPVAVVDKGYLESIEVALLLDILRLSADIQTEKTKAELVSMIYSLPLDRVIDFVLGQGMAEDKIGRAIDNLEKLVRSLRHLSVVDRINAIITRFNLYDFAARWGNDAQRRANLDLVRQVAIEFDKGSQNLGTAPDCRNFLSFIKEYKPETAFNNRAEGVKVLTLHKAKGLEWKVVILWQMPSMGWKAKNEVCGVTKEYLIPYVPAADWAVHCVASHEITQRIYNTNLAKNNAEARRLLYVGVTRARDILFTAGKENCQLGVIPDCCPTAPKEPVISEDRTSADVWGVGIPSVCCDCASDPDEQYHDAETDALVPVPSVFPYPEVPKSEDDKFCNPSKVEFPDVVARANAAIVPGIKDRMDINHPGLDDNEYGDCIHHIYAVCSVAAPEKSRDLAARTLMNWGIDDLTAPERVVASYEELCTLLSDKYGKPVDVGHEVPFVHQDNKGHVYNGVMDLLWETAEGTVIVDFKTFGGNKAEALKESIQKHASQMHEYREALTAARKKVLATVLYYPVTGVLIEVKD